MYTRKHHKRTVLRGSSPGWKDTFAIDDKGGEIYQMQRIEAWFQGEKIYQMQKTEAWFQGERFIRCRGQRHGSRGSMSDMISVLHQSVAINAKGGDC
jgi:hypothetical protein